MTIAAPLSESEGWRQVLDSSIELAGLLEVNSSIVLVGSHGASGRDLRSYLRSSGPTGRTLPLVSCAASISDALDAHNQADAVLVLSPGCREDEGCMSILDGAVRWDGPVYLVPVAAKPLGRSYKDGVIVITSEASRLDSIERWATRIARNAGSRIVLLTVIAPESAMGSLDLGQRVTVAHYRLRQQADRLRSDGARTSWEVRMGDPAIEVARLAETTGAHLILAQKPRTATDGPDERWIASLIDQAQFHVLLTT